MKKKLFARINVCFYVFHIQNLCLYYDFLHIKPIITDPKLLSDLAYLEKITRQYTKIIVYTECLRSSIVRQKIMTD